MKRNGLLLFGLLMVQMLLGQQLPQMIAHADRLYEQKDYFSSATFYKQAIKIDSSNVDVLYRYALNLTKINNFKDAQRYFLRAYKIDRDKKHPDLSYQLANSYHQLANYRYAIRYYKRAIRPHRRNKSSYQYRKIDQRLKSATAIKNETLGKPLDTDLPKLNANINSDESEFGGRWQEDGTLWFSSMRYDSLYGEVDRSNYYTSIYQAPQSGKAWGQAIKLNELNKKGWHVGNLHPSVEKGWYYFSRCDTNYQCEIWKVEKTAKGWKNARPLNSNINFPGTNNTQASSAMINGKEHLFFVSDRERGFGGLDVWFARKDSKGEFEKAINVGSAINSPDNEITPYYDEALNMLYFSSEWHQNYGGYDVFKSPGKPGDFDQAINLGLPYNSPNNDLYFYQHQGQAVLTSNRTGGNAFDGQNCCNDLYLFDYEEDSKIEEEVEPEEIEVTVEVLNRYLPVELYFHNDQPNPNSRDTSTQLDYLSTSKAYLDLEDKYRKEYADPLAADAAEEAELEIDAFFDERLRAGIDKLNFFTPLLLKELEKGNQIELTVKGYASSISASDYNLNLTLRRIQTLINHLRVYKNGVFLPYLNGTAANGGALSIVKVPFGEYASGEEESDRRLAIYSPKAAENRKIEILAVAEDASGKRSLDGADLEIPKMSFRKTDYQLKAVNQGESLSAVFEVENKGNGVLQFYALDGNCQCISIKAPESIAPGEKQKIRVNIDTAQLKGQYDFEIIVIANSVPNRQTLRLAANVN